MLYPDQIEFFSCPMCGLTIGNDIDGCEDHECNADDALALCTVCNTMKRFTGEKCARCLGMIHALTGDNFPTLADILIRDLTTVHPMPKSEVRRRIEEIVSEAQSCEREKISQEVRLDIASALATASKAPMGVSQWEAHGQKYGYWEYFGKEIIAEAKRAKMEEIRKMIEDRSDELYWTVCKTRDKKEELIAAAKANELTDLLSKLT